MGRSEIILKNALYPKKMVRATKHVMPGCLSCGAILELLPFLSDHVNSVP